MKRGVLIFLAVALAGCATSQTQWVTFPIDKGGKGVSLDAWLQEHPLKADQAISIEELSRGESASAHIVQIRKQEPLHLHESHDVTAILLKGNGVLWIGDRKLELKPGSIVTIPRGVPHSFTNQSQQPAVAYAVFNPAFDGKDFVPVTVGSKEAPAGKK